MTFKGQHYFGWVSRAPFCTNVTAWWHIEKMQESAIDKATISANNFSLTVRERHQAIRKGRLHQTKVRVNRVVNLGNSVS
jgi:hypothetical protein